MICNLPQAEVLLTILVKEICDQNTRDQISAADVRIKYFANPDHKIAVIDQLNIYINSPKYFSSVARDIKFDDRFKIETYIWLKVWPKLNHSLGVTERITTCIIFPSPTQIKYYQKVKGLSGLMCQMNYSKYWPLNFGFFEVIEGRH